MILTLSFAIIILASSKYFCQVDVPLVSSMFFSSKIENFYESGRFEVKVNLALVIFFSNADCNILFHILLYLSHI